MGRKKKKVPYKYKNKCREEKVGFISPKKARQVESFKEYPRKKAKRNGITLPEEENEEK